MEARRVFNAQFVSVFSLMRDGRALSEQLRELSTDPTEAGFLKGARAVVEPYLQFVDEENRCDQTGLRLMDVWRYFRHTWANPYKSVPGRSMLVLMRDAAAPSHPVMGIAALSSAAVALGVRDEWIGWTPRRVIAEMRDGPSARMARWLSDTVTGAINEIYKEDLLERKLLSIADLKKPSAEIISALEAEAKEARQQHRANRESADYKKVLPAIELGDEHWLHQARLALFRSKRALELASLLRVRMALQLVLRKKPNKQALEEFIKSAAGQDAVARVVRKAKADRVGTAMADLSVCGALPPYNELVCGKLMALLMASPDVSAEYHRRYGKTPSVIASSMAGRAVVRPTHLALIGTTSLYGKRPCQYDRVRFSLHDRDAVADSIRYEYLGRTEGIGTFQFGKRTVESLTTMLKQSSRGQQVNCVFGEGVNPRLRKIRDGLTELGLDADELLRHGSPRLVYGAALVRNLSAYLLGIAKNPDYILPQHLEKGSRFREGKERNSVLGQMIDWWFKRWVRARVLREDVLERVAQHNFVYPVRHGARVILPPDREQPLLFE
jgi:hypothetical protein